MSGLSGGMQKGRECGRSTRSGAASCRFARVPLPVKLERCRAGRRSSRSRALAVEMERNKQMVATDTLYSVHPSVAYTRRILDNLPEKTGRSLEEWIELIETAGPEGEKERRAWLKSEHGVGGTTAWLIAEQAEGKGSESTEPEAYLEAAAQYVEAMYAGPKAGLRPIHDRLVELGKRLGEDVKVCPCKTIVPFYRKRVFAEIKPTTRTRVDLGLALKMYQGELPERLLPTGGIEKGDRITHRIPIEAVDQIDDELERWIRVAYELDD